MVVGVNGDHDRLSAALKCGAAAAVNLGEQKRPGHPVSDRSYFLQTTDNLRLRLLYHKDLGTHDEDLRRGEGQTGRLSVGQTAYFRMAYGLQPVRGTESCQSLDVSGVMRDPQLKPVGYFMTPPDRKVNEERCTK